MKKNLFFCFVLLASSLFFCTVSALGADLYLNGPLDGAYATENGAIIAQGDCVINAGADVTLIADQFEFQPGFLVQIGAGMITLFADYDGLPDLWEMEHFGNLDQGPDDDPDGDQLTNLEEYQLGTDPNVSDSDTDEDGLPDWWEMEHFGSLDQGPNDDPDGDQLTNLEEYQLGTDPNINNPDTDDDGLPDRWELDHFGSLNQGPNDDPDNDELTNLEEYQNQTDPNNSDTDGDGMPDGWEVTHLLNPLINDAADDLDGDLYSNYLEYLVETDPDDEYSTPAPGYYQKYDALGRLIRTFYIVDYEIEYEILYDYDSVGNRTTKVVNSQ